MTKRIGVLLSGRGSNFEALADSIAAGRIPNAEIAIVVSNREGAPGIDRAKARDIATKVIPSKGLERETYDRQVVEVLKEANPRVRRQICRLHRALRRRKPRRWPHPPAGRRPRRRPRHRSIALGKNSARRAPHLHGSR